MNTPNTPTNKSIRVKVITDGLGNAQLVSIGPDTTTEDVLMEVVGNYSNCCRLLVGAVAKLEPDTKLLDLMTDPERLLIFSVLPGK